MKSPRSELLTRGRFTHRRLRRQQKQAICAIGQVGYLVPEAALLNDQISQNFMGMDRTFNIGFYHLDGLQGCGVPDYLGALIRR